MTDNIEAMTPQTDQQELADQLVEQARAEGVELIGPGEAQGSYRVYDIVDNAAHTLEYR